MNTGEQICVQLAKKPFSNRSVKRLTRGGLTSQPTAPHSHSEWYLAKDVFRAIPQPFERV